MFLEKIIIVAIGLMGFSVFAQNVGINSTGANPSNSAMLDIASGDKGLLIPRVLLTATNSAGPITGPATSLLVYNTATASTGTTAVSPGYYYWTGSAWSRLNNGAGSGWELTGNAGTNSATNFIGTSDNVNLSFRTNNVIKLVINTKGQLIPTNTGNSVLIGNNAGNNDNLSSNKNVFIGNDANTSNANAENSIVIGSSASIDANSSIAIGPFAYTSGDNATAIGHTADARGQNTTAIGYDSYVSAVGAIAIGYSAQSQGVDAISIGDAYTSGTSTIAIGKGSNAQGANNLSIGVSTYTGNGNNNSAYGNSANAQGGNSSSLGASTYAGGGNATAIGYQANAFAANTVRVGNGSVTSIGGYQNWSNVSDERFKTNIKKSTLGLDFIQKLEPVTYYLNVDSIFSFNGINKTDLDEATVRSIEDKSQILQYGFIAQDVHKLSDELGAEFSGIDAPVNDSTHYGLRYAEFVVPLVKAVQEQQIMIEELQKHLVELKAKLK